MMKTHMTDLPTTQSSGGISASQQKHSDMSLQTDGVGGKEKESGFFSPETPPAAAGREMELPKEVSSAGVKVHPTMIRLPQNVKKMGVMPAGSNIPPPDINAVALPLTDDEIAKGLHQNITESVKWLAEWCKRQLMVLRISLKSVGGKTLRTKI